MRGALAGRTRERRKSGIIPAYVGSTTSSAPPALACGDHPRVCGEHLPASIPNQFRLGSSPRMRGTQRGEPRHRDHAGIIPAYAGNTGRESKDKEYTWDHPRVCGEHTSSSAVSAAARGSSPRMRGTRHLHEHLVRAHGIIPVYAGNTRPCRPWRSGWWDHPRVCGEHTGGTYHIRTWLGSPPRMRGTHLHAGQLLREEGIIPAYAGNTPCR